MIRSVVMRCVSGSMVHTHLCTIQISQHASSHSMPFSSAVAKVCSAVHTLLALQPVAAQRQGMPGQMTWLEDPPPWLKPCLLLCFGNSVNKR